jgi:hypothetical protein
MNDISSCGDMPPPDNYADAIRQRDAWIMVAQRAQADADVQRALVAELRAALMALSTR